MARMNWENLLGGRRFSEIYSRPKADSPDWSRWTTQARRELERDYDRILFSSPVRRLGDKTQVFPLEKIESVRTRLTHSNEVSSLARSIGLDIAEYVNSEIPNRSQVDARRDIPSLLAAIGLAHDLGNPPFGHQGESAIRSWFKNNEHRLFNPACSSSASCYPDTCRENAKSDISNVSEAQKKDFLNFDGNPQTLRILTKLQVVSDDLGLNLTTSTLHASLKYVSSSERIDKNHCATKKVGVFQSETTLAENLYKELDVAPLTRNPLTFIMEACDDIAYSVLDVEDAVKKQLVSYHDVIAWLERHEGDSDEAIKFILELSKNEHERLIKTNLSPAEMSDISMQKFRVNTISLMVASVISAFKQNYENIMSGTQHIPLIESGSSAKLCQILKNFSRQHAFRHRQVMQTELDGYNQLHQLMDFLWRGITHRDSFSNLDSRRNEPFSQYIYDRISENYKRIFEGSIAQFRTDEPKLPIRYREMQLLTDMVAGMTDSYVFDLLHELQSFNKGPSRG